MFDERDYLLRGYNEANPERPLKRLGRRHDYMLIVARALAHGKLINDPDIALVEADDGDDVGSVFVNPSDGWRD